ncbi:MAG: tRNA lysidine(34) synthetase TilS [Opitutaceae bacterium]
MREAAAKLAAIFPRGRLDAKAVTWAEVASRRAHWGVGFSGGADSLALLLLIWAHWPERRAQLRVLHFNHRLRGAESRADAAFCRRVCAKLGVAFTAGAWPGKHRDASEDEARTARMTFFASHARVIWLGHQQDDIAESMLMRLARGSGAGGLAAPRPVQALARGRVHVRPLLSLKKAEIIAALRAVGVEWREDASNGTERFFRNRVRQLVLPAWTTAAQRDALAGAARSRGLLEEDDDALEGWLDELDVVGPRRLLRLEKLTGKPQAIWRRALHRWLLAEPRAGDISRAAFDALLVTIETGRRTRHSLGRLGFAVSDGIALRFERKRAR